MGRKSVVVATLLVHSVNVATRRLMMRAMAGGGTFSRGVSFFPSHSDSPDLCGQRKIVCENLGSLGLQSPLLGVREGPAPASISLESSDSHLLGKEDKTQPAPKGPSSILKNTWVWGEGSDEKLGDGAKGPSWEAWGLVGVKALIPFPPVLPTALGNSLAILSPLPDSTSPADWQGERTGEDPGKRLAGEWGAIHRVMRPPRSFITCPRAYCQTVSPRALGLYLV